MSSGSHSVSSSTFSFHIKERHNALPAHLTLKLSSSTELILTGKLMSPAGNSLLLQIFFFSRCMSSRCPHWKNKLLQWTCQARLQPRSTQRGKAGRVSRQQRYETNTGHMIMCKDHPKVWDKVSNYWRSYCTMQQSNRLFNQLDHFQYFHWSSSSCRKICK